MYYEAQNIFPAAGGGSEPYGYVNPVSEVLYTDDKIMFPVDPGFPVGSGLPTAPVNEVPIIENNVDQVAPESTADKNFKTGAVIGWVILAVVAIASTKKQS